MRGWGWVLDVDTWIWGHEGMGLGSGCGYKGMGLGSGCGYKEMGLGSGVLDVDARGLGWLWMWI